MWSDCTKIALGVKNILKWTISDTFLFYKITLGANITWDKQFKDTVSFFMLS